MLHLNKVTLRIAGRPLLEGADLHIPSGQRVGLVGRNGTGKTSLLRLITGEWQVDSGDVRVRSNARIGTVAQEAPGGHLTPLETVLEADKERAALLAEELIVTDPMRIAEVQNRLAEIGAQAAPARAGRILGGLGFDNAAQSRPLASFSGGWRMRVALAAVLFVEPDLLLLDEPTNHLDLEAALWLEDYLQRYPRTLIMVSHDRDFLNSVPQRIVQLEGRKLTAYSGNYDTFERVRRQQLELQEKARARQTRERAHIQSFVDRFRYKATKARQAQSRLKMLERMQPIAEALIEPEIRFAFPACKIPAPPLLTFDGVDVGYGDKAVLHKLDLRIDPDDRIALLGANGNGKSTFAKLVAGRLQAMSGEVTRARGIKVGFFAQHQIEDLDPEATGITHLQRLRPNEREERIRASLAGFGLTQERAVTLAKHLSGGEKTRLCLAIMCVEAPQILILDEPTNHLDVDSRQALVEAVNAFEGAVIVVSHDRHLVELTADRLWLVKNGSVRPFDGDMEAYRRDLLDEGRRATREGKRARIGMPHRPSASRRQRLASLRKAVKTAEREVQRLTRERTELETTLADPSSYVDNNNVGDLNRRCANLATLIQAAEAQWLEAEASIEEFGAA